VKTSGRIYLFSGPSGVGKSTIIRELREKVDGLGYSVSHTSRRRRSDEVDGVDYHFVDRETFSRMIKEKAFVEWALVYGDYKGTSFSSLEAQMDRGQDVILDLDSQGAGNIKKQYEESVLIYILPPSLEVIEKRLRARAADDDVEIDTRIKQVREELRDCVWYDYLIINDNLEQALREAESIILSDRRRNDRVLPEIREMFGI
jgi:guanylate kinase